MPASLPFHSTCGQRRRHLLAASAAAALLAACGGGGDDGPPRIIGFQAASTMVYVGERAELHPEFSGGEGRIEPDVGAVGSGRAVATPALDSDREYRLVVERAGAPAATRTLTVSVRFRDQYQLGPAPLEASGHVAVPAPDGGVLLLGGSRGENVPSAAIDRLDPATGRVASAGALLYGRTGGVATPLPDGRVLLTGGNLNQPDWRLAEVVDPRTAQASAAGGMSVARLEHAAVALADGRVLVAGGMASGEGNVHGVSASAEIWDPATRSFRRLAARMTMPRAAHTMSRLPDGRVLVVGGLTGAADYVFAELFDPRTETFTPLAAVQPPRGYHAALVQGDGRVLVVGGESIGADGIEAVPLASVLRYDPARGSFERLPDLLAPRTQVRAALTPRGEVLMFGGQQRAGENSASAERYDPARGGQALAALDGPRGGHTVTRLSSGRIAVVGGDRVGLQFARSVQIYK
jgi:hypothetical protein